MSAMTSILGQAGVAVLKSVISDAVLSLLSSGSTTDQDLNNILADLAAMQQSLNAIQALVNEAIVETITTIPKSDMSNITEWMNNMQYWITQLNEKPTDAGVADRVNDFCETINTSVPLAAQNIHDALVIDASGVSGLQQMWNTLTTAGATPFDPVYVYEQMKSFSLSFESGLKSSIALLTFQMGQDSAAGADANRKARAANAEFNISTITNLMTNWDTTLEGSATGIIPPSILNMAQTWLPDNNAKTPIVFAWDRYLGSGSDYGVKFSTDEYPFGSSLKLENNINTDPTDKRMCFSFYRDNATQTYTIETAFTPSGASNPSNLPNYLGLYPWSITPQNTGSRLPPGPTQSGTLVMPTYSEATTGQQGGPVSQVWFQILMLPGTFDSTNFNCVIIVSPGPNVPTQSSGRGLVVNALYGGGDPYPYDYRLLSVNTCATDSESLPNLGTDYIWRLRSPPSSS